MSKQSKSLRSKIAENKVLEKKNKTLKQDIHDVKDKLQRKLHSLATKVDDEVVRTKNTLGSVLTDVKSAVVSAKNKTSKLISGGSSMKSVKQKSKKNRSRFSWW